jgi:hypothetical protein
MFPVGVAIMIAHNPQQQGSRRGSRPQAFAFGEQLRSGWSFLFQRFFIASSRRSPATRGLLGKLGSRTPWAGRRLDHQFRIDATRAGASETRYGCINAS